VLLLAIALGLVLTSCTSSENSQIDVLAASSLTGHLDAFADSMATSSSASASLSFAGSPTLLSQALAGAPANIVIFAGAVDDELAIAFPLMERHAFVGNAITLAVPPGNPAGVAGLADLSDESLDIAACAERVPCGALLSQLDAPIAADTLEPNVRSVLTKVQLGEVDVGLVYQTDIAAADGTVEEVPIPASATTTYWAVNLAPGDPTIDAWFEALLTAGLDHLIAAGFQNESGR